MMIRLFLAIALVLPLSRTVAQLSTEALLDTIQHTAFNFFWQEANPANGLIKDRSAPNAPCSIASVGFGLSAIAIGVDHGWVSREAARDRVLTTLRTFWTGPQGSAPSGMIGNFGLFYHFLDMSTATRTWNSELSTIDTGLLLAGIVDIRQYFDGVDSSEAMIRALADSIYHRMNWNLMRNFNPGILLGWMPGTGFAGYGQWVGYNEASIMYILAMGSPTHPVDYNGWLTWVYGYQWQTYYGYSYVTFPPLFGHQYSQCWLDCRNIQDAFMRDRGITYFENSRRATLAQREYCIANPHGYAGYSDSLWGITASDSPTGYSARGAPPDQNDDGTLVPTAPISSIPFAPEVALPVIRNMWNNYRAQLWTPYGFRDAFNIGANWWDTDIIGIDQGPIIIMIENYRNQSVWDRFMQNTDVQRGLQVAGFQPVTAVTEEHTLPGVARLMQNFPNPFNPSTTIPFDVPAGMATQVQLRIYDMLGRQVASLVNEVMNPGHHFVSWGASQYSSGAYVARLTIGSTTLTRTMMLIR